MDILKRIYCNLHRQVATLPANITKSIESVNKSINQGRIPPLTKDNVLFYYIPIQGLVSYSTLSVGVMNPHLMLLLLLILFIKVFYPIQYDFRRFRGSIGFLISFITCGINGLFPRRDITDVLFLSAGSGAALWLWARPHIAAAAPARRFSWAFLGGCLWPLGSIFLWAILRSSIGQRPVLGTVLGVTTGAMLTNIAIDYFNYVELMFCGEVRLPEDTYSPNSDDEKYDIDL